MEKPTHLEVFEELTRGLPRFDDGRINFTGARKAPVVNVVVYHEGEILILKRSDKVSAYQGLWNGVSGFIDELKPVEELVKQELREELGLKEDGFAKIRVCEPYEVDDSAIDRVWVVYPVLVALRQRADIILNWEHTDFAWIEPSRLGNYEHVKDFELSVGRALAQVVDGISSRLGLPLSILSSYGRRDDSYATRPERSATASNLCFTHEGAAEGA